MGVRSAEVFTISPVSYTHLDVYKRQHEELMAQNGRYAQMYRTQMGEE